MSENMLEYDKQDLCTHDWKPVMHMSHTAGYWTGSYTCTKCDMKFGKNGRVVKELLPKFGRHPWRV